MNLRIRYSNQTIKYKRLFISSGEVMTDSCPAWFRSLPASGRPLSAPCRSQRRRPSRRGAVPASALLPPTHRPSHSLHMPVLRSRLHRVAFSRRAKMRTCENALPPSSPIPAARLRATFANAKVGKCEKGDGALAGAYRRRGGAAAFSVLKRKNPPDRRLPGRAGVQSVASPEVLPAPAGLIRGDRPRLQRHMAIIPCARSPRMQIMCRFALLRS